MVVCFSQKKLGFDMILFDLILCLCPKMKSFFQIIKTITSVFPFSILCLTYFFSFSFVLRGRNKLNKNLLLLREKGKMNICHIECKESREYKTSMQYIRLHLNISKNLEYVNQSIFIEIYLVIYFS